MRTGRHGSRHTTRRILLLAAATAGVGFALAVADSAQAADRSHPDLLDIGSVASTVDTALTPAHAGYQGPPPATMDTPGLVNDATRATGELTRQVADAVGAVTDTVDDVTAPLPIVGDVVDSTTDLTDRVVDTIPAAVVPDEPTAPPRPDMPAETSVPPPIIVGAATPQTTPGPAREHSPLVTAGPGVHQTQHSPPVATDREPQHHQLNGCGNNSTSTASPAGERHMGALAGQWQPAPRWQESPSTGVSHHGGRSSCPPPPSG